MTSSEKGFDNMVYLTLQNNYGEYRSSPNKTVAIQKCGNIPYEIALRSANCVLKCGACFAATYSWSDRFLRNPRVRENVPVERLVADFEGIPTPSGGSYNWMRVLGGEPLLNDEYVSFLFDFIIQVSKLNSRKFNNGIIIQTNGIHIGKGNSDALKKGLTKLYETNPNVIITIETSIKGTNPKEFQLITQSSQDLYKYNIQSYYKLLDLDLPNLRPVVIAGFGINESYLLKQGNSKYHITILFDSETPVYHPENWDNDFQGLYNDFTQRYSKFDPMFKQMPMYGIKDQFQYKWVKPTIRRGERVYKKKWYDAHYVPQRSQVIEQKFDDILHYFFLVSNQKYYSTLINKS